MGHIFRRIYTPMARLKIPLLLIFPLLSALGGEVDPSPSPAPARSDVTCELHGFFGGDDSLEVSLHYSRDGSARWFRVGKKFSGVFVEKADAKSGTVTLLIDGIRRELKLAVEAPPQFPSTIEELGELQHQLVELQNQPGFEEKIGMLLRDAEARFIGNHPEYPELVRQILPALASGGHDDLPAFEARSGRYQILAKQRADLIRALIKDSGDPELIEGRRLQDTINDVLRRLPASAYNSPGSVSINPDHSNDGAASAGEEK